jgi:hypothetical protein
MATFRAHFDGQVLVPDEPISLPIGAVLDVSAAIASETEFDRPTLLDLAEALEKLPDNPQMPTDSAAQVDHYLYGLPKRP